MRSAMKIKSLQFKISFWAGICLLLTVGAIIAYISINTVRRGEKAREDAVKKAQDYVVSVSKQHANHIRADLEGALDTARTLAQTLSGIKDEELALEFLRGEVNGLLKIVLDRNPQFVGLFTAWEPNAFDGMDRGFIDDQGHDETGRFIPYWHRNANDEIVVKPLAGYDKEGTGDFYLKPRKTKNEELVEPFFEEIKGKQTLVTSVVEPITVGETFYGVVGVTLPLNALQKLVDDVEGLYEGSARIMVVSQNGTIVAMTAKPELSGEHLKEIDEDWQKALAVIQEGKAITRQEGGQLAVFTPIKVGATTTPWSVNITLPYKKITASADANLLEAKRDMMKTIGIGLLCAIVALGLLWFVTKNITGPVATIVETANAIAAGDFSRNIEIRQRDEIGVLASAFKEMQHTISGVLQEMERLIAAVKNGDLSARGDAAMISGSWQDLISGVNNLIDAFVAPIHITASYVDRIAKGDIPGSIKEEYKGDLNEIRVNLNTMIKNLAKFAVNVQKAAEQVAVGSEQLSKGAGQISNGTAEQSSGVEEISSSMEQMSATINQTAENAKQTNLIAEKASKDAKQGSQAVNDTVHAMQTITEKILIIEEIASQTNMLALNAAIEAARAGKHGKGFAVVASEIRDLARNTGSAAKDINTLSMSNLEIAEKTGDLLGDMVSGIQKTAELVQEISASTNEQARGITEVNRAIQQLDQIIQQNAASTEQLASSSREFSSQAEGLLEVAGFFKISEELRRSESEEDLEEFSDIEKHFIDFLDKISESDSRKLMRIHQMMTAPKKNTIVKGAAQDGTTEKVDDEKNKQEYNKKSSVTQETKSGTSNDWDVLDENDFEEF